jgi:chromosome segregation ATPase
LKGQKAKDDMTHEELKTNTTTTIAQMKTEIEALESALQSSKSETLNCNAEISRLTKDNVDLVERQREEKEQLTGDVRRLLKEKDDLMEKLHSVSNDHTEATALIQSQLNQEIENLRKDKEALAMQLSDSSQKGRNLSLEHEKLAGDLSKLQIASDKAAKEEQVLRNLVSTLKGQKAKDDIDTVFAAKSIFVGR